MTLYRASQSLNRIHEAARLALVERVGARHHPPSGIDNVENVPVALVVEPDLIYRVEVDSRGRVRCNGRSVGYDGVSNRHYGCARLSDTTEVHHQIGVCELNRDRPVSRRLLHHYLFDDGARLISRHRAWSVMDRLSGAAGDGQQNGYGDYEFHAPTIPHAAEHAL